ncbi:MAG: imm11 family protein [Pirellulaceae bacterium]
MRLTLPHERRKVEVQPPLIVTVRSGVRPLDFTYASFDMPIVTANVAAILAAAGGLDIQRFPVLVDGQQGRHEIINVVSRVRCIDAERSDVMWWTEVDKRPDKMGTAKMITNLTIDPRRVGKQQIFRPEEWDVAIIVSDVIRKSLERENVSGVTFREVT